MVYSNFKSLFKLKGKQKKALFPIFSPIIQCHLSNPAQTVFPSEPPDSNLSSRRTSTELLLLKAMGVLLSVHGAERTLRTMTSMAQRCGGRAQGTLTGPAVPEQLIYFA